MDQLIRRAMAALVACALLVIAPSTPRAQAVPAVDRRITYILPHYFSFISAGDQDVADRVAYLRTRIGEGLRVKVGFTAYVFVNMTNVDPSDTAAVRRGLAPTFEQVDVAIARALAYNIPICLSFLTAIRGGLDSLQADAQAEDRRNMQWHSDGSLAAGWTTLSRYARKQERIQEAFVRELGRGLAARMALYPETLVAATGDGEIELSYEGAPVPGTASGETRLADYSPFAVAEFRDWLRGTGLYAPGQPFAGEAYAKSARYAAESSLPTLNADFGQNFTSWSLEFEDWSLSDPFAGDPHAISVGTYGANGWAPARLPGADGFDAPRLHQRGNAWSDLWDQFRQTMVWRHNLEFAKWITTSADPSSGATVPSDRWFSDQIVADDLFTNVVTLPSNPAGFATPSTFRLDTSASPFWTADVSPYGSLGITSFNVNAGPHPPDGDVYYRTLAAVGPHIAARGVRWGIFEWNPSAPPALTDSTIYDLEMALVEKYRPSILSPFEESSSIAGNPLVAPLFEAALKAFVNRRNNVVLTLNRSTLFARTVTDGSARTPPQVVRVSGEPGETPTWNASSPSAFIDIVPASDGRSFTVQLKPGSYTPGTQSAAVVVTPTSAGYTSATLTVSLTVTAPSAATAPVGSFDTPADNAIVSGEVGVTGWAVDDIGIAAVDIYRDPVAGEAGRVFLGSATLVPGARPDVLAAFPTSPLSEQAGWGYMLLTNMLPSQGNGVFTLYAMARDVDGHQVQLGARRINCQNSGSRFPFGTIDTPGQGATVSGTIPNFGWTLSPNGIAIDGSTINVYIDNVLVGHPVYNNARPDIDALFPGYPNTGGAVGYFMLDTTAYTNGVHTIAWVVTDSAGNASGMGSRYFTVANP